MYEYEYAANRKLFGVPDEIPDVTRSSGMVRRLRIIYGSRVSAIGKVSGFIGIVTGPPEGSQGSTGWGHLSRRAPWAKVGGEPAPGGLVRPPPLGPPAPRVGNPRGGGASTCLGGQVSPLGRRPPRRSHLLGPRPPWGPYIKRGEGGHPHPCTWRLPSPLLHLSLSLSLAKPCRDRCYFHHHGVVLLDLHQPLLPPCWIKKEETSSAPYVC